MSALPGVSCLCPTYGRFPHEAHLLEEAVESFRRQDYAGPLELVILNDCKQQRLGCELPWVRTVNWPSRFHSLGAKYNALVGLARHDVLLPWEDDDISLPWRVSQAVRHLGGGGYWCPGFSWFLDGAGLHQEHQQGVNHNASAFTRDAWRSAGCYPELSGRQDAALDAALSRLFGRGVPLGHPAAWSYVYRWGVSSCHLSGNPDHDAAWKYFGALGVQGGEFTLAPFWRKDYEALCREASGSKI